jgi:hypothetical protein
MTAQDQAVATDRLRRTLLVRFGAADRVLRLAQLKN